MNVRLEMLSQVLEIPRLTLFPLSQLYLNEIHAGFTAEVAKFMHSQPGTKTETLKSILRRLAESHGGYFVISRESDSEFLGCAGIRTIENKLALPRLWLNENEWGKGYGRDVLSALVWHSKRRLPGYLIYCSVDKRNVGARRIIEKVGGVLQDHCFLSENACGKNNLLVSYKIE